MVEPEPAGTGLTGETSPVRKWIALALLAAFAGLAWQTMEPGKIRLAVLILLGAFALRILLMVSRSR